MGALFSQFLGGMGGGGGGGGYSFQVSPQATATSSAYSQNGNISGSALTLGVNSTALSTTNILYLLAIVAVLGLVVMFRK